MPRRQRVALAAIALAAAALAAVAAGFVAGVEVDAEFLRAPIERALTAAFRLPARIEGPLTLRTGLAATVSADALVLADPSGPAGATLARGIRPAVRVDVVALLRRAVVLRDVTGQRLELALARSAEGRANWAPLFARAAGGGASTFSFGGIDRLRIDSVGGSYRREGDAPVPFEIASLDGSLPLREPATARGSLRLAGEPVAFDLRSASFADLVGSAAAFPVQGALQGSGARVEFDGELARDGSRLDADVRLSAEDAGTPLAALGIAARQPGRLELRLRLGVTATEAAAQDVALTAGASSVSGSARIAWDGPRWRVAADLAGERVDLAPFALARPLPQRTAPEALVDLLESTATGVDADVRLAVGQLAGLPVTVQDLRFEGRSADRLVAGRGSAAIAGARIEARLDYDTRKARRTVSAQVTGGAVSTAALAGNARADVSGRVAGIRGQLRAQGEDRRALLASVEADVEAHDLRWAVETQRGAPLAGRVDRLRLRLQGTRASSVEAQGKLGDAACSLKISGGALAPLLEGEPWPLQLAGSCPGGRLDARGRLALSQAQVSGELAFDLAADRIGPVAQALGITTVLPAPLAARGTLVLDETMARARLAALQLGRTAGSAEVAWPRGAGAARVQLRLATLDLDELAALADPAPAAGGRRPEARRKDLPLPDVDFELAANRVVIAGNGLRRLQFGGAVRAGRLPPAPLRFDWEGIAVSGRFGADLGAAAPRIELDATARKVDLQPLLARLGLAGVRLRADALSLKANASGRRPGELLAAATLDVALDGGQFELGRQGSAGPSGRGGFSATLAAAPGRPTTLAAQGTIDGEPVSVAAQAPGLAEVVRAEAPVPVQLRASVGEARLEASAGFARDGSVQGRLRIAGDRLDHLGGLIGAAWPAAGPYSASGHVALSADAVRFGEATASFGRSRLAGEARVEFRPGGRRLYVAALRAPLLHLEDIGADRWRGARAGARKSPAESAHRDAADVEGLLRLLRGTDVDATIDVDELRGAGERFGSGRLRATAEAGVLHLRLQEVQAAGGALDADVRAEARATTVKFALRAQARNLDYGPLARAVDPGSTAGGRLDLVADLTAEGRPAGLLPALAGTVDAALYPRGLHSDGLAVWGAGLLDSVLGQLDETSRSSIECAVTSVDFGSGVARSSALFVDSARVRIVGEFEADLATWALSGRIDPVSKEPRLLTFAPTMLLSGTVDAPRLRIAPENVVTVPLRLAAPLAVFARGFLGGEGQARAGVEGCREAFERIRQVRAEAAAAVPR